MTQLQKINEAFARDSGKSRLPNSREDDGESDMDWGGRFPGVAVRRSTVTECARKLGVWKEILALVPTAARPHRPHISHCLFALTALILGGCSFFFILLIHAFLEIILIYYSNHIIPYLSLL